MENNNKITHLEMVQGIINRMANNSFIKLDLSGSYILMNNITFEDSDYEYGGSFYNSGKGWTPIGKSYSSYFAGTFDGNGYYIDNLYINCPDEDNKGLFGLFKVLW